MTLQREASVFSKTGLMQAAVTAIAYGFLIALSNNYLMTHVGTELRMGTFVPVAAGLLFGLPAAVGSFVGNLVSLLLTGYDIASTLYASILNFLLAYTPYRLWYGYYSYKATFYIHDNRTFLKFVLLNVLGGSSLSILLALFFKAMNGAASLDFVFITFVNNFAFPLMFSLLLILLWSKYAGVKYYRPREEVKSWHRLCRLALPALIFLEMGGLYALSEDILSPQTSMILAVLGALLWCLSLQVPSRYRPTPEESGDFHSLVARVGIRLFIGTDLLIILYMLIFPHFHGDSLALWRNQQLWIQLYRNITICLISLIIGLCVVLLVVEASLTRRLKTLSTRVTRYLESHDHRELRHSLKQDTRQNELDTLEYSLQKMGEDINRYLTNLDSTIAEQEAITAQLRVATSIQQGILPELEELSPSLPGYRIRGSMTAAKGIGGDAYDAFLLDDDHLIISVADVAGKGIPAALFMMVTHTLLRQNAQEMPLAEAVRQTNEMLVRHNKQCLFVTVWIAQLELSTGRITYVNAGHNPSLIACPESDKAIWLGELSGPVLGLMPDLTYTAHEAQLPKGSRLLLYTDGLNEAENSANEFFGNQRLEQSFLSASAPKDLLADIADFVQDAEQSDDMTFLWLERKEADYEAGE